MGSKTSVYFLHLFYYIYVNKIMDLTSANGDLLHRFVLVSI